MSEIKKQLKYLENWLDEHHKYKTIGNLDSRFSFDLDDLQNFYNYITNLQNQLQQKENIIKEVRELAIIKKERVENEPDYSKSYLEGYENAIQTQHLSHSGIMLETIKSTTKKTCNDFLGILDKVDKENI